jgi:hypothetical protein
MKLRMVRDLRLSLVLFTLPLLAQQIPVEAPSAAPNIKPDGGFVDKGPMIFRDDTKKSGLLKFNHVTGTAAKDYIIEGSSSGVALLDYDNDGWLDIYLVNGSTFDALQGKSKPPRAMLFRNNHDGSFTDVTDKAGVANERWGVGVAVGDYDNDGWPDLYVTNFGKGRLYHNNHNGTFTDVAEKAGVAADGWYTGVTFGDYDGDGKLDLFIAGYVQFDINHPPVHGSEAANLNYCHFRGKPVMCGPRGLKGERDHLFHNNGDGTFTDVSEKAGVADKPGYYGFTAIFVDVNNDDKLDLVVANDSTPNYLYLNKGDGTFEDASYASGLAVNGSGREQAAMGIAVGDYRNDGNLDFFVTTFSDDYKTMFLNDGKGNFTDVSSDLGIADLTVPFLSWGTALMDYDNDAWKDLFIVNGHLYPEVDKNQWGTSYKQRPLLFHNQQGKSFELVPEVNGSGLAQVLEGRGAAFGDLFNNGKIDVVINQLDGPPVLLRNVDENKNHWVGLKLMGSGKSPKDAVGTKVFLTANGIRQRADVVSGGSFISQNDPRLHFGLGQASKIEKLEVEWPDGVKESYTPTSVDRYWTIEEGKAIRK